MRRLAAIALFLAASVAAVAEDHPASAFTICAACHLPDGAGVPGAFPPVKNRGAAIAGLDGGREYLIEVVSFGLMGNIEVDGTPYFGVMAGNSGLLSTAEIAAALNYLVFVLGDGTGVEPFTAEEVAGVQEAATEKSPAGAGQKRVRLVQENGADWP